MDGGTTGNRTPYTSIASVLKYKSVKLISPALQVGGGVRKGSKALGPFVLRSLKLGGHYHSHLNFQL